MSDPALFVKCLALALEPTDLSVESADLVIAHGAHESGWGSSAVARTGFNCWNLTAGPSWTGAVIEAGDLEYGPGGTAKHISQRFRSYGSHYDGVCDYLHFIGPGTRYEKAWDRLVEANAGEFVRELREAGFFTAPLVPYQTSVAACLNRVRALRGTQCAA